MRNAAESMKAQDEAGTPFPGPAGESVAAGERPFSRWQPFFVSVLALAGVWTGLVLLFAAQFVLTGPLEWSEALQRSVSFWQPWLVLLPLVLLLTRWLLWRKFPLPASLLAHAAGCTLAVLACHWFTPERLPPRGPGDRVPGQQGPPLNQGPPQDRGPGPGPPGMRGERPGPPRGMAGGRPAAGNPFSVGAGRSRGPFGPLGFRTVFDAVIYGGVVSVTCAFSFLRRSQQRERRTLELEASLANARLDALRLQINPHFLFNTLNAAASLVHTRPEAADEMILSLSELLRASLQGTGTHEVTLAREMELLRLYTDIERTRFGDRISFREEVPGELLAALVPALVLQPVVENAVRHGLEPRPGPGTVTVAARREGERLILSVSDDGIGFAGGSATRGSGIGLANTRDRLRALYGGAQDLRMEALPEGGTRIVISLPWHLP